MSPDDPRHGTVAGYVQHTRRGIAACEPCRKAKMRYEKVRVIQGGSLKVPALGTQRRIQALRSLGYSLLEIAAEGGWGTEHAAFQYTLRAETITRKTADRIAAVYDRLSMTPATGPKANRLRILASKKGWVGPLAWDDIDNDLHPAPAYKRGPRRDEIDEAMVLRVIEGGPRPRKLTPAEGAEVVRRLLASGYSPIQIAEHCGIKPERYYRAGDAA